ncbi:MAG: DUF2905 domain-containing protein [Bacteroidota bacterium]
MARILIISGILLILIGLLWPWIAKLGLGRLPGDVCIERAHVKLYIPITTSILLSMLLSGLFCILRR